MAMRVCMTLHTSLRTGLVYVSYFATPVRSVLCGCNQLNHALVRSAFLLRYVASGRTKTQMGRARLSAIC